MIKKETHHIPTFFSCFSCNSAELDGRFIISRCRHVDYVWGGSARWNSQSYFCDLDTDPIFKISMKIIDIPKKKCFLGLLMMKIKVALSQRLFWWTDFRQIDFRFRGHHPHPIEIITNKSHFLHKTIGVPTQVKRHTEASHHQGYTDQFSGK